MATAHRCTSGGLNLSSGGELKLYLKGKRNTLIDEYSVVINARS